VCSKAHIQRVFHCPNSHRQAVEHQCNASPAVQPFWPSGHCALPIAAPFGGHMRKYLQLVGIMASGMEATPPSVWLQVRIGGIELKGGRYEARAAVALLLPSAYRPASKNVDVALLLLNAPSAQPYVRLAPGEAGGRGLWGRRAAGGGPAAGAWVRPSWRLSTLQQFHPIKCSLVWF
jgi:hypothetical protein